MRDNPADRSVFGSLTTNQQNIIRFPKKGESVNGGKRRRRDKLKTERREAERGVAQDGRVRRNFRDTKLSRREGDTKGVIVCKSKGGEARRL